MICKLDPNKAHGYDMISIHMSKMSDNTIVEPLFTIFKKKKKNNLKCGIFPDDWKKWNILAILKQCNKQNTKSYCAVCFFPVWIKVFECIIHGNMLKYFLNNNSIFAKHSWFRPGDFCTNQLFTLFDDSLRAKISNSGHI